MFRTVHIVTSWNLCTLSCVRSTEQANWTAIVFTCTYCICYSRVSAIFTTSLLINTLTTTDVHLTATFHDSPDGGGGDNWGYKICKAPFKSSPPPNPHPALYRPDALPVTQPTVSEHWREELSHSTDLLTPSLPGDLPILSLTTKSPYGGGLPCLSSASRQYPTYYLDFKVTTFLWSRISEKWHVLRAKLL